MTINQLLLSFKLKLKLVEEEMLHYCWRHGILLQLFFIDWKKIVEIISIFVWLLFQSINGFDWVEVIVWIR